VINITCRAWFWTAKSIINTSQSASYDKMKNIRFLILTNLALFVLMGPVCATAQGKRVIRSMGGNELRLEDLPAGGAFVAPDQKTYTRENLPEGVSLCMWTP